MTRCDAVVIGAGAAGLSAAAELAGRGLETVVLEARERLGGRIWTMRDAVAGAPVELGAEFLHGETPMTRELLREAKARVVAVTGEHRRVGRDRLMKGDFWKGVDRVLGRIDPADADESIADFLARRPGGPRWARDRGAAREFVEGFHAADLSLISAASLAVGRGAEASEPAKRSARVVDGYGVLVEELARRAGAAIRLGTVVHEIEWRRGEVRVAARTGGRLLKVEARAAIVTLPLGVLQAPEGREGAVRLRPDPPAIRRAIDALASGFAARLILAFAEPPWLARGARTLGATEELAFLHFARAPFQAAWTPYPLSSPHIVLWSGGPRSRALARQGEESVREEGLRLLAGAFGTRAARLRGELTGAWFHDWESDPFARGAYSYVKVGGAFAAKALARPVEGTLFFAGEAAAPEDSATVEGALTSGRRAARRLAEALLYA